jgi:hypothetical protein
MLRERTATVPPTERKDVYLLRTKSAHGFRYDIFIHLLTQPGRKCGIKKFLKYLPTTFDRLQTLKNISNCLVQLCKVTKIENLPILTIIAKSGDQMVKGRE